MIDLEIVYSRLEKLREYTGYLEELKKQPKQQFIEDPFIYGNAERYLQLSIQTMLDIGNHIISSERLEHPDEYRDIFEILGKTGAISEKFANQLKPLAGLRNILVHDYLSVDRTMIYEMLQERLADFDRFMKYISDFVE